MPRFNFWSSYEHRVHDQDEVSQDYLSDHTSLSNLAGYRAWNDKYILNMSSNFSQTHVSSLPILRSTPSHIPNHALIIVVFDLGKSTFVLVFGCLPTLT